MGETLDTIITSLGLTPRMLAILFIAYFLLSNIVSAMPTPQEVAGVWYRFIYNALHLIFGNAGRMFRIKGQSE